MAEDADYWIDRLGLAPHPEGGRFRETYRAAGLIGPAEGGSDHPAGRPYSTAILYLLRSDETSRLHRLRSDEIFHHYRGSPLRLHRFAPDGEYRTILLGGEPERGGRLQAVVPAGHWFGAIVEAADSYALVGCTVAPGFDFADFELGERHRLLGLYPAQRAIIERLTPGADP